LSIVLLVKIRNRLPMSIVLTLLGDQLALANGNSAGSSNL
jgi:hypothetical protein